MKRVRGDSGRGWGQLVRLRGKGVVVAGGTKPHAIHVRPNMFHDLMMRREKDTLVTKQSGA